MIHRTVLLEMTVTLMHPEAPSVGPRPRSVSDHNSSFTRSHSRDAQLGGGAAGNGQGGSREPVNFPRHSHTLPQPRPVQILRKSHARSRSASSFASGPFAAPPGLRERAASIPERSGSPRPASVHNFVTLPRGIVPKPTPVDPVETETEETIGAFSPTSCPRRHLHHFLETAPKSWRSKRNIDRLRLDFDPAPDTTSQTQRSPSDSSPPLSPIPSISRTPSSYSGSEYFPTAPSSAGPATPVHSASTSPVLPHKVLRPILEALEDASKFRVRTACAACGQSGSNFPCCPRCNEMWCSRECRLKSTGGRRHVCKKAS